jgi:hypothetical protein
MPDQWGYFAVAAVAAALVLICWNLPEGRSKR